MSRKKRGPIIGGKSSMGAHTKGNEEMSDILPVEKHAYIVGNLRYTFIIPLDRDGKVAHLTVKLPMTLRDLESLRRWIVFEAEKDSESTSL